MPHCDFEGIPAMNVWDTICSSKSNPKTDFAGNQADSKSASGGVLCIFGLHTFVPASTQAEIVSLDTGLRMEGIPALNCETQSEISCSHEQR